MTGRRHFLGGKHMNLSLRIVAGMVILAGMPEAQTTG
jgi:hypothetical protein